VGCQIGDAGFGAAPLGNILMRRDPAAARKRVEQDLDGPAIVLLDDVDPAFAGID
jgi:hypothetical protein